MCGIAGIMNLQGGGFDPALIRRMTDSIAHRGPDADGFFEEEGIALGHRRLSIIDLSAAANQPFSDNSGRYRIIFNGEMYNYEEVKARLKNYSFRTTSDTEVILAAYIEWGPDCLKQFAGMFSFVIWDRQDKEIFLVRDRLGVKPLYYFLDDQWLVFASETRAILASGLVQQKINHEALRDYFRFQSIGYPFSLIRDIRQLHAGAWMRVRKGRVEEKIYWQLDSASAQEDYSNPIAVQDRIRDLLMQSVKRRMVSDVPVGAFLSGGIDSSVVVGLMAGTGNGQPNTFTVCFGEKDYDESKYAELVASRFKANHTEIFLKPEDFLHELIPALDAMDTPSGDGINTYVVSKAIRQKGMKVALSGIGGDELFAGYPYFSQYLQLRSKDWLWKFPEPVRRLAALFSGAKRERVTQLLEAASPSIAHVYPIFRQIISPAQLDMLTELGTGTTALERELLSDEKRWQQYPLLSQVSAAEYNGYTQHTLLKDADQMSMASSLELREPFFDHELIEYVMGVPDNLKKPIYPKSLLVESVKPLLPDDIVHRKKQGFLFPWELWLRKELRSFCERNIGQLAGRDFINGPALRAFWKDFLEGNKKIRWAEIWLFVVLNYWLEKNHAA